MCSANSCPPRKGAPMEETCLYWPCDSLTSGLGVVWGSVRQCGAVPLNHHQPHQPPSGLLKPPDATTSGGRGAEWREGQRSVRGRGTKAADARRSAGNATLRINRDWQEKTKSSNERERYSGREEGSMFQGVSRASSGFDMQQLVLQLASMRPRDPRLLDAVMRGLCAARLCPVWKGFLFFGQLRL